MKRWPRQAQLNKCVANAYKEFNHDSISFVIAWIKKLTGPTVFERTNGSSGTYPKEQPSSPDPYDSSGRQVPGPENSQSLVI